MATQLDYQGKLRGFIETVDCLPLSKLPDGPEWTYEIKLDGYRLEVVRKSRMTTLYSRRENVLNQRFPYIAAALQIFRKSVSGSGLSWSHGLTS